MSIAAHLVDAKTHILPAEINVTSVDEFLWLEKDQTCFDKFWAE